MLESYDGIDSVNPMKAKSALLLYHLLWSADTAMNPTFRNLNASFEGWAYRNGFLPQIHRLEAAGFLESLPGPWKRERFVRLTEDGRIAALGGRDPEVCWTTPWDKKWRLVLFDLPEKERALRMQVRRALIDSGSGCLQGSVWISPRVPPCAEGLLKKSGDDCSHLILLEAESRGTAPDRAMVQAAWNFSKINTRYHVHRKILSQLPKKAASREVLLDWGIEENAAWLDAVRNDPLLPTDLLPPGYAGRTAWEQRLRTLQYAAAQVSAEFSQHKM